MNMLIGWDKAVKDLSENDDVIARIIANYPDERMEMKNDTLHTLVRSIVGQQISVKAADAIWNRLEKACGNSINEKNLLKLNTEELRETGLSKTKSSYILNVVDANLSERKWENMSDEEVTEELCKIKGIGPWTAEMMLMFSFMRPDVFSIGDIGLIKAVKLLVPTAQTKEDVLKISHRWSPYRTAASWYLWRMLDPIPVGY